MSDFSPRRLLLRRLAWHRLALFSFGTFGFLSLICLSAPWIAPAEFDAIDLGSIRQAPSLSHWRAGPANRPSHAHCYTC